MALDGLKGLVADGMLDLTGVLRCRFLVHAHGNEKMGQKGMSLVDLFRYGAPFLGQRKMSFLVRRHVAAAFQKSHGTADAGLGLPHMLANIDGAYRTDLFFQKENGLKIHFSRFLQGHNAPPCQFLYIV